MLLYATIYNDTMNYNSFDIFKGKQAFNQILAQ